ncbi:MAG TPA: hypothetical protein VFQ49_01155, partial [Actinomycetes bacterium]|nr:hypothetical protein [Actinomycetes bacterium]
MGRFSLARLDLRARVVLFTSAIVVGALLLLGAALHALLAKSLYTQQNYDAVQQVKLLTRPGEISDVSGVNTEQIQDALKDQLIKRLGGQPNFEAVVLRGEDGTPSSSDEDFGFKDVPADLAERVEGGNELAYVYIRSPVGPGR